MSKLVAKLKTIPKPSAGMDWADVLFLILSGTILGVIIVGFFRDVPLEDACAGPGPADFGCTGGWEAVLAGIFGAVQVLFFVILFSVAAARLFFRMKHRADKGGKNDQA